MKVNGDEMKHYKNTSCEMDCFSIINGFMIYATVKIKKYSSSELETDNNVSHWQFAKSQSCHVKLL